MAHPLFTGHSEDPAAKQTELPKMSPGAVQTPNKASALSLLLLDAILSRDSAFLPGGSWLPKSTSPPFSNSLTLRGQQQWFFDRCGRASRSSVLFAMSCQINKHPHASLSQRGNKWVPALIIKQELAGLSTQVLTGQVFPIWNWTGWSSFLIQLSSLFPLANERSQLFADILTVRVHARERSFLNFYRCICHLTIFYWLSISFISAKLHGFSW